MANVESKPPVEYSGRAPGGDLEASSLVHFVTKDRLSVKSSELHQP